MTVLLAGASVFAEEYNPDKVTVTSDNFETYTTISRAGSLEFRLLTNQQSNLLY